MFDTVLVRYPLDVPAHNKFEYQTKDLENGLFRYMIDVNGHLWLERVSWVEAGETPPPAVIENIPFHGDLDIYGGPDDRDTAADVRYYIRFIHGRVSQVARCTTRTEQGWLYWEENPFPPIEPRRTALVPPVFPPVGRV